MAPDRLQRKLHRINGAPGPPRAVLASGCMAAGAAAMAARPGGTALVLAGLAVVLGIGWLRGYQAGRPLAGAMVRRLAVGAFAGGCLAGVLVDAPDTARAWLQLPAAHGGPGVALVLLAALAEDLARGLRRALARDS